MIPSRLSKPNSTMPFQNIALNDKCLISLVLISQKYLKDTTWLYSPTDRRDLVKLTRCSVVIGKLWFLKTLILNAKTLFFKIYHRIKILLDSFQEPSINSSSKSMHMNGMNPSLESIVLSFKSIIKKSMISFKIFPNPKLWISINLRSMESLWRDLQNMLSHTMSIVSNSWKEVKRIDSSGKHRWIQKVVDLIRFFKFCWNPFIQIPRECSRRQD